MRFSVSSVRASHSEGEARGRGEGTLSAHADLQTEIILMEMLYGDDYDYYYYGGKHCSALWHKEKP